MLWSLSTLESLHGRMRESTARLRGMLPLWMSFRMPSCGGQGTHNLRVGILFTAHLVC